MGKTKRSDWANCGNEYRKMRRKKFNPNDITMVHPQAVRVQAV